MSISFSFCIFSILSYLLSLSSRVLYHNLQCIIWMLLWGAGYCWPSVPLNQEWHSWANYELAAHTQLGAMEQVHLMHGRVRTQCCGWVIVSSTSRMIECKINATHKIYRWHAGSMSCMRKCRHNAIPDRVWDLGHTKASTMSMTCISKY